MKKRISLFTWHIHGSYLYYLSQGDFEIFIPVNDKRTTGYIGRGSTFPFGKNVHEVHVNDVKNLKLDCILFQTPTNYYKDQYELFTEDQLNLPKLYLEHDPPQQIPTDTKHFVSADPNILLVHVTHFNRLMWDNGVASTAVIDHGVAIPKLDYEGSINRGVVVINNLDSRGRRLGLDIFLEARKHVPLDLIGMEAENLGGNGEILHPQLPEYIRKYRFFFNPIRYTSLGLAVIEAMMLGVPVVGLATTEMVTVIQNGYSGVLHTNLDYLISQMKDLLTNPEKARMLGENGKKVVMDRFNIKRFADDWYQLLDKLITNKAVVQFELN